METAKLVMPIKGVSWPDLVLQVPLNLKGWEKDPSKDLGVPFPFEKRSSIRPAISGRVKMKYPGRIYRATEEVYSGVNPVYKELIGQLVLMVRRIL